MLLRPCAGIFLDNSSQVVVERTYFHDPRLGSNSWATGHPEGPTSILVSAGGASAHDLAGNHVIRWNDLIGSDTVRWNDGIEGFDNSEINGSFARDSDIYGNMFAFGNDDMIELDGGMENVRFFHNKGLEFFTGVSVAPNRKGPSYVFNNVISRLNDQDGNSGALIKQGGGDLTRGMTYLFNNTLYSNGTGGIIGTGYGTDSDRTKFFATSYNNLIYLLAHNSDTIEDEYNLSENDFDYDNLTNASRSVALTDIASWQETNGIFDNKPDFGNVQNDDLTLIHSTTSGINHGKIIPNFTDHYTGELPDQGAFETGQSNLMPVRPIAITASTYRVELLATAGGSTNTYVVDLNAGLINGSQSFQVVKSDTTGWLNVTPSSGVISDNDVTSIQLSVNTSAVTSGNNRKAVILVRLANGLSIPITVHATIN